MIKAFIIAAISADGFIAEDSSQISTSWTGKSDKKLFVELTKRAGVVVMGSTTYKTIGKPLKDRLNIVYSRSQQFEGTETTTDEPLELLKKLEERGYTEVAICGGSEIYSKFMEAGAIDTIHLTVEPVLFGSGVPLFKKAQTTHLQLISSTTADNGALFNEYKVIYGIKN